MADALIDEGLTLMLVGMGTVFVFLAILVAAMTLMSRLTTSFLQADAVPASTTEEEIAAITAAIAAHRRRT